MEFHIFRTSGDRKTRPCKAPKMYTRVYVNESGSVKGHAWFIKIESIQDLLGLIEGPSRELVITDRHWFTGGPAIEIYDEHRE